ncbi:tyrosine-protein phosphatase [Pseudomaricurvus sp.]|uniref:tyrosine-protein phosphatase n=1 Tax=Pseudomaricurvus sp. TaxID=2004510 RepID=UPI003F6CA30F
MIDIHCHLLPGIDDGPKSLDDALTLARQAVREGVTHSVVTPHIHPGRWENNRKSIHLEVRKFRESLKQAQIPLTIGFAGEVRLGMEVVSMLHNNELPFVGRWEKQKVLLLELPHSHILPGTENMVKWLLKNNVIPMIAHPERNKAVMRDVNKLNPLIDLGCLFQVTAGSLIGQFGERARVCSEQLLRKGVVTVLASDAHHFERRPVNLGVGRDAAVDIVGAEMARKMVFDVPYAIAGSLFTSGYVSLVK